MNHLIFYTSTNQKGRHDATGAFIPEAKKLEKYLHCTKGTHIVTMAPIKTTGVSIANRVKQVQDKLCFPAHDHIYFLCHGYKTGIQLGYKWKRGASHLVDDIMRRNPTVKTINFYCCSVAKGVDNFAKWVFSDLDNITPNKNVQVFGHFTAGHTTKNPRIKIYSSDFEQPFIWGLRKNKGYNELISSDKSEAYKMIQDDNCDLRFQLPHLPIVLKENGFTWGLK
jgi:hypothetical protein